MELNTNRQTQLNQCGLKSQRDGMDASSLCCGIAGGLRALPPDHLSDSSEMRYMEQVSGGDFVSYLLCLPLRV